MATIISVVFSIFIVIAAWKDPMYAIRHLALAYVLLCGLLFTLRRLYRAPHIIENTPDDILFNELADQYWHFFSNESRGHDYALASSVISKTSIIVLLLGFYHGNWSAVATGFICWMFIGGLNIGFSPKQKMVYSPRDAAILIEVYEYYTRTLENPVQPRSADKIQCADSFAPSRWQRFLHKITASKIAVGIILAMLAILLLVGQRPEQEQLDALQLTDEEAELIWHEDQREFFSKYPHYLEDEDKYNKLNDEVIRLANRHPDKDGFQILMDAHVNIEGLAGKSSAASK